MSKKSNKNYKFTNISNFFVQLKKIGANRCFNFLSIPMRAPFFKSRTISRLNAFNLKGRFLWILLVIWWNLTALVVVGFKTKSTESSLSNKWPLKTTSISYFKREMGKKFSKKRLYFLRQCFFLTTLVDDGSKCTSLTRCNSLLFRNISWPLLQRQRKRKIINLGNTRIGTTGCFLLKISQYNLA